MNRKGRVGFLKKLNQDQGLEVPNSKVCHYLVITGHVILDACMWPG